MSKNKYIINQNVLLSLIKFEANFCFNICICYK